METQRIIVDRDEARDLYRSYKKHLHYSTPLDREIMRAHQLIAQGRLVIKALESVAKAGLDGQGFPKLAIARADAPKAFLCGYGDGSATMSDRIKWRTRQNSSKDRVFRWPAGTFPGLAWKSDAEALAPLIPLHLRPRRGIENYHILWEAEWRPVPPKDPFLLRRIGKADMWLVVAAWDLTEVERTALAARISA